jgi:hypothetical protein
VLLAPAVASVDRRKVCVICFSAEHATDGTKLISACRCYKKTDANRVHAACVTRLFEENDSEEAPHCPYCGDDYAVRVRWHFDLNWARCLSCRSVAHAFEFVIVLLMIGCAGFTLVVFRRTHAREEREAERLHRAHSDSGVYAIYALFAITLMLVPLTLWKVCTRWQKANSGVELDSGGAVA